MRWIVETLDASVDAELEALPEDVLVEPLEALVEPPVIDDVDPDPPDPTLW